MNIEIERKFLVNTRKFNFPQEKKKIKQGYLFSDNNQVFRIRKINEDYLIAYKYKKSNIERLEFEYKIPATDGEELLKLSDGYMIEKDRYFIPIKDKIWEIDFFCGYNEGLVIAEIELISKNEIFFIPDWIEEEVSHMDEYLNFNLSKNPYSLWKAK